MDAGVCCTKVWSYDTPADLRRGYPNIPNVRQITSILVRRLIKSHKKTYRNWSWKSEPYPTYAENIKKKWTIAQQISAQYKHINSTIHLLT